MSEVSQKQLEANRENAKLGGVKTEEGKAVSRYNAIKHGLLSREVLLDDDDENALIELGRRIRSELKPIGEVELLLTDRVIADVWRLKRLLGVERETMEWQRKTEYKNTYSFAFDTLADEERKENATKKSIRAMIVNEDIEKLLRYEITIERSIYKALHELQRIQSARMGEKPPAPVAIDVDVSKE